MYEPSKIRVLGVQHMTSTALTFALRQRSIRSDPLLLTKDFMTDGTTRREFLGSIAAFSLFPFEQEKPELILHNGHIMTMNPAELVAEAVAISGGRFFAVGKKADVMNLAGSGVRKIDLGGKTVLPGFVDAHSHPAAAGLSHLRMVDCDLRPSPRFRRQCASALRKGLLVNGSSASNMTTQKRMTAALSALPIWMPRFQIIPCT